MSNHNVSYRRKNCNKHVQNEINGLNIYPHGKSSLR